MSDRAAWSRYAAGLAKPTPVKKGQSRTRLPRERKALLDLPAGLARYRLAVEAADALWEKAQHAGLYIDANGLIRVLPDRRCRHCRMKPWSDAHHLVTRTHHKVRWRIECGAMLCRGCHDLVGRDSHENEALAVKLLGSERWEQLNVAANMKAKADPYMAAVVLREILDRAGIT